MITTLALCRVHHYTKVVDDIYEITNPMHLSKSVKHL